MARTDRPLGAGCAGSRVVRGGAISIRADHAIVVDQPPSDRDTRSYEHAGGEATTSAQTKASPAIIYENVRDQRRWPHDVQFVTRNRDCRQQPGTIRLESNVSALDDCIDASLWKATYAVHVYRHKSFVQSSND